MAGERVLHHRRVCVPKRCRSLEVGEEERHRSRRQYDLGPLLEHSVAGWYGDDEARALVLEGLVARADPLLQVHELGTGLQTDVVEGHPCPLVGAQRVGLATTPVEGDHEQRPPSLA